jgi:hypothetical protein
MHRPPYSIPIGRCSRVNKTQTHFFLERTLREKDEGGEEGAIDKKMA